jgi:hypothetical protein
MSDSTKGHRCKSRTTDPSAEVEALEAGLLKMRAVLVILHSRHGTKLKRVQALVRELQRKGLGASQRTVYRWRRRYLIYGFGGLVRQRRSDCGRPRAQGLMVRIAEAALRARNHGDIRREYAAFQSDLSYESFRNWLRLMQQRVTEMPGGGRR